MLIPQIPIDQLQQTEAVYWKDTLGRPFGGDAGTGSDSPAMPRRAISFADCVCHVLLPFSPPGDPRPPMVALPGVQMINWSKHRDQYPVTGHGASRVKGYTSGHRTVAGSLALAVFGETPFAEIIARYNAWRDVKDQVAQTDIDDLPPLDVSLVFITPESQVSRVLLRGVKFIDESNNLGLRDPALSQVFSFMALSVTNVVSGTRFLDRERGALDSSTAPDGNRGYAQLKGAPNASSSTTSTTTVTTGTTTTPSTTTSTTTTTPSTTTLSTTSTTTITSTTTTPPTTTLTTRPVPGDFDPDHVFF